MYYISSHKTNFIRNNFYEYSFSNRKPSFEKFQELNTSSQLHYLANIYNWDDGTEVLNWIIDSPLCDFGTAVLIFWRAEPTYYTRYSEAADHDDNVLHLLQKIIKNFHAGKFNRSNIKYDPAKDHHDVNEIGPDAKWTIPNQFKKSTRGRTVISNEHIQAVLFFIKRYFKELKRQRHRNRRKIRTKY